MNELASVQGSDSVALTLTLKWTSRSTLTGKACIAHFRIMTVHGSYGTHDPIISTSTSFQQFLLVHNTRCSHNIQFTSENCTGLLCLVYYSSKSLHSFILGDSWSLRSRGAVSISRPGRASIEGGSICQPRGLPKRREPGSQLC
jgi:hypothetical protein